MSENRVNQSNEQLKAEMRAAENRRAQMKGSQKAAQAHTSSMSKTMINVKEEKSAFDHLLENMSSETNPMAQEQGGFEGVLAEVKPRDEQSSRQETKDEKKESRDKSENRESTQDRGKITHQRVAAKHNLKEQGEGQGDNKDKKDSSPKTAKKADADFDKISKKSSFTSNLNAPPPPASTQVSQVEGLEALQGPKELPPAVLAQIIQAATISRDKELNTEMRIEFQDNFFNGTSLKVLRDKNGNISITFLVPNRQLEATFKNERDKIAEALGKKDLDVRNISVELS